MDNIWQRHRTFILKILAGLGVVLVCWIVGSSLYDASVSDLAARNEGIRKGILRKKIPSATVMRDYDQAIGKLEDRIRFVAAKAGEIRASEDLRTGLVTEILDAIGENNDSNRQRYLQLARTSPVPCVAGLEGDARNFLANKASLANVRLPDSLGLIEIDPGELERHLVTLATIIHVVEVAIEERVYEIQSIQIGTPPRPRFEGEDVYIQEYPISVQLRGPSITILRFIERMCDPKNFVPIREVQNIGRERSEHDDDTLRAAIDLMALRIDPEAQVE